MLGDRLNAVGVPNQALLFRRLQGLQYLVNGRAEIKRLAEIAAKVHRPSSPACVLAVLFVLNFDNQSSSRIQLDLRGVWQSARLVVDSLRPLIWEMAPEMDNEERMTRIYGAEDDGI